MTCYGSLFGIVSVVGLEISSLGFHGLLHNTAYITTRLNIGTATHRRCARSRYTLGRRKTLARSRTGRSMCRLCRTRLCLHSDRLCGRLIATTLPHGSIACLDGIHRSRRAADLTCNGGFLGTKSVVGVIFCGLLHHSSFCLVRNRAARRNLGFLTARNGNTRIRGNGINRNAHARLGSR